MICREYAYMIISVIALIATISCRGPIENGEIEIENEEIEIWIKESWSGQFHFSQLPEPPLGSFYRRRIRDYYGGKVIRTVVEWEKIWGSFGKPAPKVDFSEDMVLCIIYNMSTRGRDERIEIRRITKHPEYLLVEAEHISPVGPWPRGVMGVVYCFAVIPRSPLSVKFDVEHFEEKKPFILK